MKLDLITFVTTWLFTKKTKSNVVLNYALVDEVDSILIDEARTPLIISGPGTGTSKLYKQTDRFVKQLKKDVDYKIDLESKTVSLTDEGIKG